MDGARIPQPQQGAKAKGCTQPGEGRSIYSALAAARSEFTRAAKDATNPHLRNRYPTLASIVEACEEALGRNRLTYSQPIVQMPGGPVLRTVLVHLDTGERIESDCPLLYDTASRVNPMQALGSAVTYARRYSLETLLGLMREDDDGEGAYPRQRTAESSREPARESVRARENVPTPTRPATIPVREPLLGDGGAQPGGDEPAPRPFRAWAVAASEMLGIELSDLMERLHESAVRQGHMPAVDPEIRPQALARRYHDRQKGREWRDWMRDECKAIQTRFQEQPEETVGV